MNRRLDSEMKIFVQAIWKGDGLSSSDAPQPSTDSVRETIDALSNLTIGQPIACSYV